MDAGQVTNPAGVAAHDQAVQDAAASTQVLDGALGDHAAAREHHELVAEPLDQVELVGGEQDGHATGGVLAQQVDHRGHGHRVEPGERLVEHEQLGTTDHGGGDLHALLVAQRERLELVVQALAQSEPVEQVGGGAAGVGGGAPLESPQVDELIEYWLLGVEAALLGHVAERAAVRDGGLPAVPQHTSGGGLQDAHDHAHGGGLPGAVTAHEAGHGSTWNHEFDVVHRDGVAEASGQSVDAEHGVPP